MGSWSIPLGWSCHTAHLCFQGPSSHHAKSFPCHSVHSFSQLVLPSQTKSYTALPVSISMWETALWRVYLNPGLLGHHQDSSQRRINACGVLCLQGCTRCRQTRLQGSCRCRDTFLFQARAGGTALDKKGIKPPCEYMILGPLDLWPLEPSLVALVSKQGSFCLHRWPPWNPMLDICNYKQGLCKKEMESAMKTQQTAGEIRHRLVPMVHMSNLWGS